MNASHTQLTCASHLLTKQFCSISDEKLKEVLQPKSNCLLLGHGGGGVVASKIFSWEICLELNYSNLQTFLSIVSPLRKRIKINNSHFALIGLDKLCIGTQLHYLTWHNSSTSSSVILKAPEVFLERVLISIQDSDRGLGETKRRKEWVKNVSWLNYFTAAVIKPARKSSCLKIGRCSREHW